MDAETDQELSSWLFKQQFTFQPQNQTERPWSIPDIQRGIYIWLASYHTDYVFPILMKTKRLAATLCQALNLLMLKCNLDWVLINSLTQECVLRNWIHPLQMLPKIIVNSWKMLIWYFQGIGYKMHTQTITLFFPTVHEFVINQNALFFHRQFMGNLTSV